ncbi:MAG: RluA family pseudouridine synthase [Hydrogenophaga sp.]|nr:RluA family pseudouridine synthase [Hydrogenophaga sp.]
MGGVSTPGMTPEASESATGGDDALLEVETRCCEIPVEMHGWRVDRALARLIPEFSRSYLQQLMADGAVQLLGAAVHKPSTRIQVGHLLQVELRPTQQAMAFVAQPMALDVVFEDAHLLVVNKPAGLVVHPAAGNWSGTLLNGLLAHHAAAAQLPRAGIVHRLDKDTSGLMLVGKSRAAVEALVRAIAAREVHRGYVALAQGRWKGAAEQLVDQPVGRDTHNRLRMAVLRPDATSGKPAQTTIRLLDGKEEACLVVCKLHTGRTHQIRVHMAWLGHPLVGDSLYGGKPLYDMPRQALHATRLRLLHPISGEPLAFQSAPPADFQEALSKSGLHYNEAQLG